MDKQTCAKAIRNRRRQLSVEQKMRLDLAIRRRLEPYIRKGMIVAAYRALPDEVNLDWLLQETQATIIWPRVQGQTLEFVHSQTFVNSHRGIAEPTGTTIIPYREVDLFLVPLSVFRRDGYRIGYGGGYYDRVLQRSAAVSIGVAYHFQEADDWQADDWDERLSIIVTDRETIIP